MTDVYRVKALPYSFRNLDWTSDWKFSAAFLPGRPIEHWEPQKVRYKTLEEDIEYEKEMEVVDENGDVARAHARYKAGPPDNAFSFGPGLLISGRARTTLADLLDPAGQLIPVDVEGDPYFFFNCTRLLDAADPHASEVDCHEDGRPSGFSKLVVRKLVVAEERVFRLLWPADVLARNPRSRYPTISLFVTGTFVARVREAGLTGFEFSEPIEVR